MSHSPLVAAAADYLTRGLSVIALTGKTPNVEVHRRGLHQALSGAPDPHGDHPADSYLYDGCPGCGDLKTIRDVFEHPATTGIAIVIPYPYVVVDIDGEEGAQQWKDLTGEGYVPWPRWVAKTARGLHIWFSCITPTGTIKLGPKLDLKGQGGYVAAPPSQHPDGPIYEWLAPPLDGEPPLEVPQPLEDRIVRHAKQAQRREGARVQRKPMRGPRFQEGDHFFYAQSGFDALIEGMATAEDGNRNNYLHWAAATLAEEGAEEQDFEALDAAAIKVGLERVEVGRTIRSAQRKFE